ncbi:Toxoplasma gondii family A protein [Toxoplasma gondii ME49]|uniref:Toxoplasma gondii family A protein n=1 Tax=Toxoplasma gondii (strain ATCC 50611 / Me49) TaxID=508771 RepID=S8GF39_TOXGM|nr:Toxoplasma gondii family A protein [Toxoplasma gondii ME49]EPT30445.1 Toxoplasma gondii family A protein [Toxoplasma gondii ME49]|eukprot:XP_002366818.1 Toxoplasma gondii family A protein [Toxoplasma gondii ME49]
MEHQALRAVLLTFLVATVVPCAASDANGPEREPDFIVTIGPKGVEENTQQVFFLGPSATLRVADESGKAIFLPQPASPDQDTEPSYNLAYVYENGHCNFAKTLAYRDAFPGYSRPLWVRSSAQVGRGDGLPAGTVANYTLTNPPADSMSGGVSFCVRFTKSAAATTTTTTKAPTEAADSTTKSSESTEGSSTGPTDSSGSSSQSGGGSDSSSPSGGGSDSSSDSGEVSDSGGGSGGSGSSSQEQNNRVQREPPLNHVPKPEVNVQPQLQQQRGSNTPELPDTKISSKGQPAGEGGQQDLTSEDDNGKGVYSGASSDASSEGAVASPGPEAEPENGVSENSVFHPLSSGEAVTQDQGSQESTSTAAVPSVEGISTSEIVERNETQASEMTASQTTSVGTPGKNGAVAAGGARLRRLSDKDASAVKYLTIVVHSAAWGLSAGSLMASAVVLSITVTFLSSV